MLHQAEEERQVGLFDALFVEREDQRLFGGVQQEVGIFDAFRNPLVGKQSAGIILRQETTSNRLLKYRYRLPRRALTLNTLEW